jgi:anti-sigma factor ChrR (cupin superfamily)
MQEPHTQLKGAQKITQPVRLLRWNVQLHIGRVNARCLISLTQWKNGYASRKIKQQKDPENE